MAGRVQDVDVQQTRRQAKRQPSEQLMRVRWTAVVALLLAIMGAICLVLGWDDWDDGLLLLAIFVAVLSLHQR